MLHILAKLEIIIMSIIDSNESDIILIYLFLDNNKSNLLTVILIMCFK
jgi:hypothetical protein